MPLGSFFMAPSRATHFVALRLARSVHTSTPMTVARRVLAFVLLLALTASSLGMAMSRGAMAAEGQLCSVTGPMPIALAHDWLPLLDDDGTPVTLDREVCLDCVMGAWSVPASHPAMATPACAARHLSPIDPASATSPAWLMGGAGRGPPLAA